MNEKKKLDYHREPEKNKNENKLQNLKALNQFITGSVIST